MYSIIQCDQSRFGALGEYTQGGNGPARVTEEVESRALRSFFADSGRALSVKVTTVSPVASQKK